VAIAYEPGTGALFMAEKGFGDARVLRKSPGTGAATTALTLDCVDGDGERGLLGIAFDPDYLQGASTRFVYLYYTRLVPASGACAIAGTAGSRNRVSRFLESGGVLTGEEVILEGPVLNAFTNHNAGTLRFAPDETLFVSMGDNNTGGGVSPLSRDLGDLRGKILRIRRDGSIPTDNPFFGQLGRRGEIWAWGFRNPFRFSIDPLTSIPWIGDVGEGTYEEIDRGVAGGDYGWPCFEGPNAFLQCNPAPASPIAPAYFYGRTVGATVIGGPVYRSGSFPPEYEGKVFFGDYAYGWIRRGTIDGQGNIVDVQLFIPDAGGVVDIIQAPNGCLVWASISTGDVHQTCPAGVDADGDGFTIEEGDCVEGDASVYPGSPDLCDGTNNDCAGGVDDATCATFDAVDGVDGADLALLGRTFGACPGGPVDYTHDGCADGDDLAVMSAVWGCRGTAPICP
jgi:glucose/arabinose dehydrogenase